MSVKGLKEVLQSLKVFGDVATKEIGETTQNVAKEIEADAKKLAPSNLGTLRKTIHNEKVDELNYKVVSPADYSAYVEFGTGKKVSVPSELSELASKFKGKGGGFEKGLQSIKDWCRNKGIDESAAYPIFMSILRNGIRPQPFMYPAWKKGQTQYVIDLKDLLKDLTKKYN